MTGEAAVLFPLTLLSLLKHFETETSRAVWQRPRSTTPIGLEALEIPYCLEVSPAAHAWGFGSTGETQKVHSGASRALPEEARGPALAVFLANQ